MKEKELVNQPKAPVPGWGSECQSLTKATSPQTVTCRMGGSGGRPARWAGPRRQAGPSRGRGSNRAPPHPAVGHNVGLGRAGRGRAGAGRGGRRSRGGWRTAPFWPAAPSVRSPPPARSGAREPSGEAAECERVTRPRSLARALPLLRTWAGPPRTSGAEEGGAEDLRRPRWRSPAASRRRRLPAGPASARRRHRRRRRHRLRARLAGAPSSRAVRAAVPGPAVHGRRDRRGGHDRGAECAAAEHGAEGEARAARRSSTGRVASPARFGHPGASRSVPRGCVRSGMCSERLPVHSLLQVARPVTDGARPQSDPHIPPVLCQAL